MRVRHSFMMLGLGVVCATVLAGQQYTITTFAGNGTAGYSGDNGPANAAQLNLPGGVALDAKGNVYIADGINNVVRMVSNGTITTVAGNNTQGASGDNGPATKAQLNNPSGVVVDSSGNLYIADTGNHVIRKVTSSGTITTFAGSGTAAYGGDGGSATAIGAAFIAPSAVALDASGNLYIADTGNNLIRKVAGGNLSSVVGIGSTATKLNNPTGIAFDSAGALYIADRQNRRIAKFAGGTLTTFAGNGQATFSGDNGPATAAALNGPTGVAVDHAGNVLIADTLNNRIRKVATNGIITTIAGRPGKSGYTGDNGDATAAALDTPKSVAVDATGNIYFADSVNSAIRLLQVSTPVITVTGVVNAASGAPPISPGALATVQGSNLATASAQASPPLPNNLIGTVVQVNGQAAPLLYVAGGQINFQVPWETAVGNATVTVSVGGTVSSNFSVPVVPAGPGLMLNGPGFALVQNADLSFNSDANPAAVGSTITAYVTGSGPVTPAAVDGAVATATLTSPLSATIGGIPTPTPTATLSPSLVGVALVSIVVPDGLDPGDYPLVIGIGDESSNAAAISVTAAAQ